MSVLRSYDGVKGMARITYYVVVPFVRMPDGGLLGLNAEEAPSQAHAEIRAFTRIGALRGVDTIVGAIAFSRSGDPPTGHFEDAVILARYGETPDDLERGGW
ncbi:hypothetical protein GCM10007874_31850 [Labrys miyagiensis]|uniref:Uncharacterized protein n=2 Tax=Labrys miyagiensis TaxID=346912 RepID=A0ABQ6CKC5_9HYPH|nr:hypothetical protein GCM10007874_31850 [Labrys miyagiensis]